jgi:hypothetical protein
MKRILFILSLSIIAGGVNAQTPDTTKKTVKSELKEKPKSDTTKNQQKITVTEEGMSGKKKNAKTKHAAAPSEGGQGGSEKAKRKEE